jgi:tetratricopeptide (TPR) repeat protein
MGNVPDEIDGFGASSTQVRQNPKFDLTGAQMTSEDYFVWSRIDGSTSIKQLVLMMGFATDKTIGILNKLRSQGAVMLPGETPAQIAERLAAEAEAARAEAALTIDELSDSERAAMAEDVILDEAEKLRVLALLRIIQTGDLHAILGVDPDVNKRTLKRAYFKMSKEFHPDRYYGKKTGSFGEWFSVIFEAANSAFEILSNPSATARYEAARSGKSEEAAPARAQTHSEHAAELFERACGAEAAGQHEDALKLYAASIRVEPQPRYMRRAATCAVHAKSLDLALEYAKKAAELQPSDPSYTRVVADVYRASGMLRQAEDALIVALALKSENDVLTSELRADLDAVRDQLKS